MNFLYLFVHFNSAISIQSKWTWISCLCFIVKYSRDSLFWSNLSMKSLNVVFPLQNHFIWRFQWFSSFGNLNRVSKRIPFFQYYSKFSNFFKDWNGEILIHRECWENLRKTSIHLSNGKFKSLNNYFYS